MDALCSLMDHGVKIRRYKWVPANFMLTGGGLRDRVAFHPGGVRNRNSSTLLCATDTRINLASIEHSDPIIHIHHSDKEQGTTSLCKLSRGFPRAVAS